MRPLSHVARRGSRWLLLMTGIVLTASCGTSPTQAPQRPAGDEDALAAVERDDRAAAERDFRDSPYADLFADAERALDADDWMTAQLALPQAAETADIEFTAYEDYIAARIAWQRGQLAVMNNPVDERLLPLLSDALVVKILQLQRQRAQLESRHLAASRLSIRMLEHLPAGHADAGSAATHAWQALQRLTDKQLETAATAADNEREAGWLTAAYAYRFADNTDGWHARYPGHPAGRFLSSNSDVSSPRRVALLLPLGGRIADAAAAVRDGFIKHYFSQQASGAIEWDLIVLDTTEHASPRDAYDAAIDSGAQLVVGPLTKAAVTGLLAAGKLPVPVIALNRADGEVAAGKNSLQFALAPEDEAAQIARLAFADGHRHALIVSPAGEWGTKMTRALSDSWTRLGGTIAASATPSSRENHSSSLAEALDLEASRQRGVALRRQLGQPIETSGRRRQDIDAVFLLAPSVADARSLKPLLAYHYAGDLPAYATSSANSDESRTRENDLNGLILVEMPQVLGRASQDEGSILRGDGYERLGALGADACRLAALGMRSYDGQGPILQGETGFLSVNGQRQIERDLEPAVFDRGALRRR
ncbi:MAG: penicillin-binding protein activator [Chromatocurvus sp.]